VIEAAKKTVTSESNGSLMRISPMAVWAHKIEDMNEFITAIKLEISLSHANQTI
jgi:ADP-ribosylglycohydrolase